MGVSRVRYPILKEWRNYRMRNDRPLDNQPDKPYKKEDFPLPKERTFEEWVLDLEASNRVNLMNSNCLMVTSIQWNELKKIVLLMLS